MVYSVQRALKRREFWRWVSKRAVESLIFVERAASVFSKCAGELSSPWFKTCETFHPHTTTKRDRSTYLPRPERDHGLVERQTEILNARAYLG